MKNASLKFSAIFTLLLSTTTQAEPQMETKFSEVCTFEKNKITSEIINTPGINPRTCIASIS